MNKCLFYIRLNSLNFYVFHLKFTVDVDVEEYSYKAMFNNWSMPFQLAKGCLFICKFVSCFFSYLFKHLVLGLHYNLEHYYIDDFCVNVSKCYSSINGLLIKLKNYGNNCSNNNTKMIKATNLKLGNSVILFFFCVNVLL